MRAEQREALARYTKKREALEMTANVLEELGDHQLAGQIRSRLEWWFEEAASEADLDDPAEEE